MRTVNVKSPLVTVAIPSYNHARFIEATIDSVLRQTLTDLELIVVDDQSTDDSVERIQRKVDEVGDPNRMRLIVQKNAGLPASLNRALREARGRYFSGIDSDDLWEPTKLEKQVAALEAAGESAAASFTDTYLINEEGKRIDRLGRISKYRGGNIFEDLLRRNFCPTWSTNLFVREKLTSVGAFNEIHCIQDFDLWVRTSLQYEVIYVPEPLCSYRIHSTNMSRKYPDLIREDLLYTINWALEKRPEMEPFRRRITARIYATCAADFYNNLELARARREAIASLRIYKFEPIAWRVLIRSSLGGVLVKKLRSLMSAWRNRKFGAIIQDSKSNDA
jgi:glycosyltransferase involved in cell wall biosynthesis